MNTINNPTGSKIGVLKDHIVAVLLRIHPKSKKKIIERYLDKTMNRILQDIFEVFCSRARHTMYELQEDIKMFNSYSYRDPWGRITLGEDRPYANSVLTPILFEVLYQGTSNISTAVRFKERTMDALMELAISTSEDELWAIKNDINESDLILETPIAMEHLRTEISNWQQELNYCVNEKRKIRLLKNIKLGRAILTSPTLTEDNKLQQVAYIADSQRIYLRGLSLQTVTKEVRHAALGNCYLYDMRVGAFAVTAAIAKSYAESQGLTAPFSAIKGYVLHKDDYRLRITRDVYKEETVGMSDEDIMKFYGFYNVKEALTAVGFGAKRSAKAIWKNQKGEWTKTSLIDTFKNKKDKVTAFLDNTLAKSLIDDYIDATNIISYMIDNDAKFKSLFKITDEHSKGERLALVYQTMEQVIMNQFVEFSKQEFLLPVHDGIYFPHPVDYPSIWHQFNHPYIKSWELIQFDRKHYGAFSKLRQQKIFSQENNHKAFIEQQERDARNYIPKEQLMEQRQEVINILLEEMNTENSVVTQEDFTDEEWDAMILDFIDGESYTTEMVDTLND